MIGEVCWQAVAFEDVQENVYGSPWFRVTGPSEPLAFMSTETGPALFEPDAVTVPFEEVPDTVDPPVDAGAGAREIVTLSAAVATPSVQVIVNVTGAVVEG